MELRAANILSPHIEGHYALYSFVEQISTKRHRHDFFELFLIERGSIYHHIHDETLLLHSGTLVFIRPDDVHYFQPDTDKNCELINLAFSRQTFEALAVFLELATLNARLLAVRLPPMTMLTVRETERLGEALKAWGQLMMQQDSSRSRVALRALLAQIITRYFIARVEDYPADAPRWLVELCEAMHDRANIIEGREALMRLAQRSPEYVGRVFKRYLDITPSQFINNLRLDYAGELLLHSEQNATDICYEVGFENLSHFYRLFKARWDCSPQQFRKLKRRTTIP